MNVFLIGLCLALAAIAGLVLDGARAMSARVAASTEAAQAARVGATQALPQTGCLDPGAALAAAEGWMAQAGHPGTAFVVGQVVYTRIQAYELPSILLGSLGLGHFAVSATGSATAVSGSAAGAGGRSC